MAADVLFHMDYLGHYYPQMALLDYLQGCYGNVANLVKVGGSNVPQHLHHDILCFDPADAIAALHVVPYNKITDVYAPQTLEVDEFLLKNCVLPYSPEEKEEIRIRYRIRDDKPLVVIGRAACDQLYYPRYQDYFSRLASVANLFFFGDIEEDRMQGLKNIGARIETGWGHQKQVLAVASASIYFEAAVQPQYNTPMHDIVEGTANCRHFHVNTGYKVYGYDELCRIGAVLAYDSEENMLGSFENYIRRISVSPDKDIHNVLMARASHIDHTRHTYLPIIRSHIDQMLGLRPDVLFHKDLVITEQFEEGIYSRRIRHVTTKYRTNDDLPFLMRLGSSNP